MGLSLRAWGQEVRLAWPQVRNRLPLHQFSREAKEGVEEAGSGRERCWDLGQIHNYFSPLSFAVYGVFAYANKFILPQLHSNQEQITFLLFPFSILN